MDEVSIHYINYRITRSQNVQFIKNCFKLLQIEGHSGINMIPIDPLHIPNMGIKQGSDSPVNIELKFTDVDLIGLSDCRITKIGLVFGPKWLKLIHSTRNEYFN